MTNHDPKCRCGHLKSEHFAGRGMSKDEMHPCNYDTCECLKFDAWQQDPNVMTHAVCRHGVTKGDHCPDCEAMKE